MKLVHALLAITVMAIWGLNLVVAKTSMEIIPPFLLCFFRFFLLSTPAILFVKRPKVPFKLLVGYGLFMFLLQYGFLFFGLFAGVSPGVASILSQSQVFFSILLGVICFKEKVLFGQILGGLLGFSGIAVILLNLGGNITFFGCMLVLAAALAWALGNIVSKQIGKVSIVSLVIWASFLAWPPFLLISFFAEGTSTILDVFHQISWQLVGSVLYISFVSTLVAFSIWSYLIHHNPVGKVAPFTLLLPVFGILASVLLLGEPLQLWKIIAALLVIGGLGINVLAPKLQKKTNLQKKA